MAGRSKERLENLRDDLAKTFPTLTDIPIIVADSFDNNSLRQMAARTRVICSTVGPYAKYGSPLVEACIDEGTDYCDLTGETHWMRRIIDAYHESARHKGVRIVHTCGFDSIPSDLGTLMVQDYAMEHYGAPCDSIKLIVWRLRGGMSGGTLASMSGLMEEAARDREVRRLLADPYALNPSEKRSGPDGAAQRTPRHDDELGIWTGPFIMAAVNEPVVRRTNAILGFPYGNNFRYHEAQRFGKGPKGALGAAGFTAGLGAFAAAMSVGPTRNLLEKFVLPAPGEGPSRKAIENGHFTMRLFGQGTSNKGTSNKGEPFTLQGEITGHKDPGYGATAIMLIEAGLCLAFDDIPTDATLPHLDAGVLTPASALGMTLVNRLRDAGMGFDIRPI
jgi:short subunit dehydrogenase-like uncharacterized protein